MSISDLFATGTLFIRSSLDGYILPLIHATGITLSLAIVSLIAGLIFAFVFLLLELMPIRPIAWFFSLFTITIRALPELLIVVAIYNGLPLLLILLNDGVIVPLGFTEIVIQINIENFDIDPFLCGVMALSILYAVYAAQTLRGAFKAISSGQKQAAQVLGLSKSRTFLRIIVPQMWCHALPGLSNQWLILLKDTALVSVITVNDLMMQTMGIISRTKQPFVWYFVATLIYLVISILSQKVIYRIEKRSLYFEVPSNNNNEKNALHVNS